MILDQDDFMFAIKIADYYGEIYDIDPTVLEVLIYQQWVNIDLGTGAVNDEIELYDNVKCGDRFQNYPEATVEKLNLENMICIDEAVRVRGSYYAEDYREFGVLIQQCVSGTTPYVCKTQADIDAVIT